jgi:hypothetical protein
MGREQFIGTWKLVSFDMQHPDGQRTYPMGKGAVGIIMYDASGNMSVQIMRPDRPDFASDEQLRGTQAEIKSAFEGYIAYYGVYQVNQKDNTVTHHVKGCLFPNWVGRAQKRFFEFSGNRLILTTPPVLWDGQQATGALTWERADSQVKALSGQQR